jgi:hypothetical protein
MSSDVPSPQGRNETMTNKMTPKVEHAFPERDDALGEADCPTGFARGCLFALPLSLAL